MDRERGTVSLREAMLEQRLSTGDRLFRSGLEFAAWMRDANKQPGVTARYTSLASNASLITQIWALRKPASDDFIRAAMAAVDLRLAAEPDRERVISIRTLVMEGFDAQRQAYGRRKAVEEILPVDLTSALTDAHSITLFRGGLPPLPYKALPLIELAMRSDASITVVTDTLQSGLTFWAHLLCNSSANPLDRTGFQSLVESSGSGRTTVLLTPFTHPVSVLLLEDRCLYPNLLDSVPKGAHADNAVREAWLTYSIGLKSVTNEYSASVVTGQLPLVRYETEVVRIARLIMKS